MNLSEALRGVTRLGVDTSPFIYFVERHPTYVERVRTIFLRADRGEFEISTSVITLLEVLVVPTQANRPDIQQAYRAMLFHTAQIVSLPIDAEIAEQAAVLRSRYRLRTPDAIQLATAMEARCEAFLTNDRGLQRVNEMQTLLLDELEPDDEI